jgi:hypothetical protein
MKIIFSRKGFDSQYGRVPSPIFPDGTIVSLPIPSSQGRPLGDLVAASGPLHRVVSDLTAGRITASTRVHLDPDLQASSVERLPSWRPCFGQDSAAQQHLANQGVGVGDVFLYFGWYRQAELHQGRWRYVPGSPDIHSLFGWLEVGDVLKVGDNPADLRARWPWIRDPSARRARCRYRQHEHPLRERGDADAGNTPARRWCRHLSALDRRAAVDGPW